MNYPSTRTTVNNKFNLWMTWMITLFQLLQAKPFGGLFVTLGRYLDPNQEDRPIHAGLLPFFCLEC